MKEILSSVRYALSLKKLLTIEHDRLCNSSIEFKRYKQKISPLMIRKLWPIVGRVSLKYNAFYNTQWIWKLFTNSPEVLRSADIRANYTLTFLGQDLSKSRCKLSDYPSRYCKVLGTMARDFLLFV